MSSSGGSGGGGGTTQLEFSSAMTDFKVRKGSGAGEREEVAVQDIGGFGKLLSACNGSKCSINR